MELKQENIARVVLERIMTVKFFPSADMKMVVVGNEFGNVGFWSVDSKNDDGDGYMYYPHSAHVSGIFDSSIFHDQGCVKCLRKMKNSTTTLYCGICSGSLETYNQSFKVLIRARDESGEAIFVLFNNEAEQLFGVSIDQVLHEHNQDDNVAWWVDSGATCHVCKDLHWFKGFQPIEDGSVIRMDNIATEPIKVLGNVKLVFTFEKTMLLDNVLYAPKIRKNLLVL